MAGPVRRRRGHRRPSDSGGDATLIGDGITVDDVAAWSGTIGYEVLTGLGRRYQREWLG
jgi:alanine racemase